MLINADFNRVAVVTPDDHLWTPSPQAGVERIMLDRIGGEVARATSLVRYAPDSQFPVHEHERGEEILVLSGAFSEGARHYPAGWYLRNPPGSSHQPSSRPGALIFVKLRQMPADERVPVRVDSNDPRQWSRADGRDVCPLYSGPHEVVSLQRIDAGQRVLPGAPDGAEILVVDGLLKWDDRHYPRSTWIRLPPGRTANMVAGDAGVTVYLKTGHLVAGTLPAAPDAASGSGSSSWATDMPG